MRFPDFERREDRVRRFGRLALRLLAIAAWSVWVGGFSFYGGVVVPILDADLGSFETGLVSRKVTVILNLIGGADLGIWWLLLVVERGKDRFLVRFGRITALIVASGVQGLLFWMHRVMEYRLDHIGLTGFRRWHESYLIASTVQWGANLLLMTLTVWIWTMPQQRTPTEFEHDPRQPMTRKPHEISWSR